MTRARIKANFTKSQYSQSNSLLDGYLLIVEGDGTYIFKTREEALAHAEKRGYQLAYSGQSRPQFKKGIK